MKKIFILLFLLFIGISGFATHIVGGDITVQHVSGNNFNVSLRFYRDCSPGTAKFDNPIWIGLYDKVTNSLVDSFSLSIVTIKPLSLGDSCYAPGVCVEEGVYSKTVTIANNPNGYYLSWQRCCRNSIVQNIVNPLDAGLVYYVEMPDPALGNSSPLFGSYAKTYMCSGTLNTINFAATDVDGDSLVYSLVTPLNGNATAALPKPSVSAGPYSTITWQTPYSLTNIMGSTPNVAITPTSGVLTVMPTTLGVFVFAVKVEEYRGGIKIGEITRDIQYQVINCTNPITPGLPVTLTCKNSTAVITASSSAQVNTYTWFGPGIVSGGNTSSATVNVAGTYTVTTTSASGCTYSATVNVLDNTVPPTITVGSSIILSCQTTSGTISANSTTANVNYAWTGPLVISNGNTATPTVGAAGTYTVVVSDPNNGCTSSATVVVNSNAVFPNVVAGSPLTLTCATTSGIISASSSTPNVTYAWSGPNIISGGTTSTPSVNAAGKYTVVVTDPANGCTNSTTILVNSDNTAPNVSTTSFALTCNNVTGNLLASSTTPGVTYYWSGNGIVSGVSTASPTVNAAGTYTVVVTNPISGCTSLTTVNVINNIVFPTLTTGPSPVLTCIAPSNTITVSSSPSTVNYMWSGPGVLSGMNTSSAIVNATGTYTVTVINPANGCSATATVSVTNNTTPPQLTTGSSVSLTCTTKSTAISATSTTANATYSWTGTGIVSGNNTSSPVINGTGTYTVVVTNPLNGCTNSGTVQVNSNITPPDVTAGSDLTLTCLITNSAISANSTAPGALYNWNGPSITSGINTSTPTVNAAGTYTVIVTNPANGCTASATVAVVTAPPPTASVSAGVTLSLGTSTTLVASGGGSYSWSPSSGLSCSNCPAPVATPTVTTVYCVTVTDQYGCKDTACVEIKVFDPCPLSNAEFPMPNVFTPNGDGDNDLFFIKDWNNECIASFSIEIYDRWGLRLFKSNGQAVHWNGRTQSGAETSDGTYYYIVKVKKVRSEEKTYKGFFSLFR